MLDWLVPRASTFAGDIDDLIFLVGAIVGVWFVLAQGVFFYFIFRFRHREGGKAVYLAGEHKRETRWVSIPHFFVLLCDIVIVVAAIRVWVDVKQTLPPAEQTVRIIAQQWAWTFVHPGPDGVLETDDDITTTDELHVEVDTVHHFRLEARDVVHSFSVPAFRLKQDAIPGRRITGWFEPTRTGTFDVQCAEICGIGHGLMGGRVVIETRAEHAAWMARHSSTSLADAR